MGATVDGTKELTVVVAGFRESELSWKKLLLDLKARGLRFDPLLTDHWRWCSGFLESSRESLSDDSSTALHCAQDSECARQDAQVSPASCEESAVFDL